MGASFRSGRNTPDPSRPTSAITTMNPRGLASGGVNRGVTQLQPQTTDPGRTTTTTPPNWGSTGKYSTNPTLANGQTAVIPRPVYTRPTGAGYGTPANTQNWINPAPTGGETVQGTPPPTTTPAATTPPPVSATTTTPTTGGAAIENTHDPVSSDLTTPTTPSYSTADYFRRALGITGSGSGSAVLPAMGTQNFTAEQINQGLGAVTTPQNWTAPPEGMFSAPSTPDSDTLLAIGGNPNLGMINPTQVQNIMNRSGNAQAAATIAQDLSNASPAQMLANAVRQQQTSQAAIPQMYQDLRNVPQLYSNPITRAQLPAEIRQAEEQRLNGGPDWRTASFGDAIDGNNVTRPVARDQFQAPQGQAPTQTPAQQQANMVADFVNSYLPYMNNPGARSLQATYNVNDLNSALQNSPQSQQLMVANRLTGLTPSQLQIAMQTSGLTLPQFLAQAVTRLAG